jgi:hypothetical protein
VSIALYSNRYRQLTYGTDSDYNELDGCNSDNSFWYSNSYRALPFFIIKPKLKIEDCQVATDPSLKTQFCSFYLHNAGKRTAKGIRIKFKIKQKIPQRPRPPKLVHEFGTLNLNSPAKLTPFDLDPDETISIRVCMITKGDQRAIFNVVEDDQVFRMPSMSLEKGRKYGVFFRFVGRNFYDRKVWCLELDLRHEKPSFSLASRNVLSQYLSYYLWNRG